MIGDTIRYLKDHGKKVIYDAEHSFDGYADEPEYALATWQAAEKSRSGLHCARATRMAGVCRREGIAAVTSLAKSKLKLCASGIHTHNDCGFGVANAIAAVEAGAMQVQGTINGFGERTGNCNPHQRHPPAAGKLKMGLGAVPKASLPKLKELSRVCEREWRMCVMMFARPWVDRLPLRTRAACTFTPSNGFRAVTSMPIPDALGNFRRVLVSDMSGRTNILHRRRKELGFKLASDAAGGARNHVQDHLIPWSARGYEYEAAEGSLALLIGRTLKHRESSCAVKRIALHAPR